MSRVDDEEIKKFAETGCGVAYCPCSNMRLGSGIAPIKKYLEAGVKVGLGHAWLAGGTWLFSEPQV
jgi:8-oxoguanine deaminase